MSNPQSVKAEGIYSNVSHKIRRVLDQIEVTLIPRRLMILDFTL
jgi:hypothetical protein